MNASEFAKSLRELADWYDEHPDVPLPAAANFNAFLDDRDALARVARLIGIAEKGADPNYFFLKKRFGEISLDFNVARAVACERRVVGVREIPETVVPARTEEIVEWDCHPIFKTNGASPAGG